jgi:hypothetical protein
MITNEIKNRLNNEMHRTDEVQAWINGMSVNLRLTHEGLRCWEPEDCIGQTVAVRITNGLSGEDWEAIEPLVNVTAEMVAEARKRSEEPLEPY